MPMLSHEGKSERAIDGNTAAAHVAYAMSALGKHGSTEDFFQANNERAQLS